MQFKKNLFFVVLIHCTIILMGQEDNRMGESDIKIEDRFVQAKLLQTSGKKKEAIKLLDSLRRESPNEAAVYFELARIHYDNKDYNQAETNLASSLRLSPDNVWYRNFEVDYMKAIGRNDDAIKTLDYLLIKHPKNIVYYDKKIDLQIKKNDLVAAIQTLDAKDKNIGWNTSSTLQRAEILDNAGKINDAVKALNVLIEKYPKETKYLKLTINMLHANDKISESEPYLLKILEIDPNDADAKLGLILLSNKKVKKDDFLVTLYPLMSNPEVSVDIKIKELLPFVKEHAEHNDSIIGNQLIELCDKIANVHPTDAKAHAIYGDVLKNNGIPLQR